MTSLLELRGVSVSFDGFLALNDLNLRLQPGELRAVIGPNGAGKTTFLDVITGKVRPTQGDVFFRGSSQDRVAHLLGVVGLQPQAQQLAGGLSHGQKQWLEIAMLLAQDPDLLLVDEPVAGLSDEETERTGELLCSLAGDHTVLVIEHDMDFIRNLDSPVTVLHEGHVLCEGSMQEVQNDPRVIEVYLGVEDDLEHATDSSSNLLARLSSDLQP